MRLKTFVLPSLTLALLAISTLSPAQRPTSQGPATAKPKPRASSDGPKATFTQADLERIVAELDPSIPHNAAYLYPIKCNLVKNDEVNASAGYVKEGTAKRAVMIVYTGLATSAQNDPRLIRACIAHELTHLSRGHSLQADPAARDLSNLWTRQQEYEADRYGAESLVKAGFAKKDMVDLLMLLDRTRGRDTGAWLDRLTADHADPKARAAEISDDPTALQALVLFDTGLAYEDARNHLYAQKIFTAAAETWPALTEGYTNAAKSALMFYYDRLPVAVRAAWWRPDFGPLITTPHAPLPQAVEVTDEDREAWRDAFIAASMAVEKTGGTDDAGEVLALAQVLEPDAKKDVVQRGIDWFKSHGASATNPVAKLRFANNAGVGLQRTGDLSKAYATIMDAQKSTTKFNYALGENLGLVTVKGRSKEDDTLAVNVLYTWLGNTPSKSPRWKTVKKTFDAICTTQGLSTKPIPEKPAYLCRVATLVTSGKELGLLLPINGMVGLLGQPERKLSFSREWPDLTELRWNGDKLSVFTERGRAMRLTSSEPGAYLILKPTDATSDTTFKITVGMTKAALYGLLNEGAAVKKDLAQGGQVQEWNYYPTLGMGVRIEGDKIAAITVTPVEE